MKKTISKVFSMLLTVALLATMFVVTASADVVTLSGQRIELTAPTGEINVGDKISIPITISNPLDIQGVNITITWDPTMLKADPTFKLGKYNCFTYPKANEDGVSIQDAMKDVNVNEVANGKLVYGAAAGYAFEGYETPLSAGTLNFTVLDAAAGKNVTVTVADAVTGTTGAIVSGTYATYIDNSNVAFDAPVNATFKVAGGEPEVPTAADLGLFTDATQNAKVTEKVMTSNGYSIEKALLFVSGINKDAAVVAYGTEITCEGFTKVLDIPCANFYDASETVKGFVAAVSSIRNDNLTKTFTAKAYADVTVGEETVRIYATDAATAVYGN